MKVIFLDFDGVLNSWENKNVRDTLYLINNTIESKDQYGYLFDERCVRWLQYIIAETEAKIVVTSMWRWRGKEAICQMWADRNLPYEVYDIIRFDNNSKKGECISDWLQDNNVDSYCIIDDQDLFSGKQKQNSVLINGFWGLNGYTTKEIVKILNK